MNRPRYTRKKLVKNLSVSDIAKKYNFHPHTVRAWVHRDGIRHQRRGNKGDIYIREDDLKAFLEEYYDLKI